MTGGKKQMDLKKIQTPVLYMKSYNKLFCEPELYLLICSQLLDNMGLNCMGARTQRCSSTAVLHDLCLLECFLLRRRKSRYRELTVKLHVDFLLHGELVSLNP